MQPRLTQLNYNEILMYLGHRGRAIPPEVEDQIRRCMAQVMATAQPRLVYRRLPVVENGKLCGMVSLGDLSLKEESSMEAGDALTEISSHLSSR